MKIANPQGKGSLPVLADLARRQDVASERTPVPNLLARYVISRVVLCADFNFKPVAERAYFLYLRGDQLRLSMISPQEWRDQAFGAYLGVCTMKRDHTWDLEDLQEGKVLVHFKTLLRQLRSNLLSDLGQKLPLKDTLPDYDAQLNYHRRIAANGLAFTMNQQLGELTDQPLLELVEHYRVALPFLGD